MTFRTYLTASLALASVFALSLVAGVGAGLFDFSGQLSNRGPAAIPSKQISLDLGHVEPIEPLNSGLDQEAMNLMLPTDMEPTSDSTRVSNKVMDRNVQNLLQGRYMRNNKFVQSAQKVQQAVQPKFSFGSENGVQHTFNMQYEAFQKVAKLKYEGYLESDVIYEPDTQDVTVAFSEPLNKKTKISVEHESKSDLSLFRLNWNW